MAGQFLDFDKASAKVINTSRLGISKATWIRIDKENPGVVKVKTTFSEVEDWQNCYVLNPRVTPRAITSTNLDALPETVPIPQTKQDDLCKMLPYLKEENKGFFQSLCSQ